MPFQCVRLKSGIHPRPSSRVQSAFNCLAEIPSRAITPSEQKSAHSVVFGIRTYIPNTAAVI